MNHRPFAAVLTCSAILTLSPSLTVAQNAPAAPVSTVVANPTYVSIVLETDVARPAADVWRRVGSYCAIGEWLPVAAGCQLCGTDGAVGAIRSVGNEVLVAKTEFSYTYTQPVREGRPYNLYHGTLEVLPVTSTTSRIIYTLLYDNSMLADDAARERDRQQRTTTFTRAIQNMKTLAEGGTLPPPTPPAAPPAPAAR